MNNNNPGPLKVQLSAKQIPSFSASIATQSKPKEAGELDADEVDGNFPSNALLLRAGFMEVLACN